MAAFVLAVNRDFAAKAPVTHNVASRKIGDQWIVINNKELFQGQLDVEKCYISMAVFISQSQAPADDFKYNVDTLQNWGACLDLYRQYRALQQESSSSTATDTSAERKIQLYVISSHLPQFKKCLLKKSRLYS